MKEGALKAGVEAMFSPELFSDMDGPPLKSEREKGLKKQLIDHFRQAL